MTNSTNWPNPERPGVVMWPHKDGRHLFAFGGSYIVAFWRSDKQWLVSDDDHDLGFCASDRVKDLNYLGPVLTPAQIAEMLAAERQRCAVACSALGDQCAGKAARQETAYLCAANIRSLGAAP